MILGSFSDLSPYLLVLNLLQVVKLDKMMDSCLKIRSLVGVFDSYTWLNVLSCGQYAWILRISGSSSLSRKHNLVIMWLSLNLLFLHPLLYWAFL